MAKNENISFKDKARTGQLKTPPSTRNEAWKTAKLVRGRTLGESHCDIVFVFLIIYLYFCFAQP